MIIASYYKINYCTTILFPAEPDKCQDGVTHNCTQVCVRTSSGGHECHCKDGYYFSTSIDDCDGEPVHNTYVLAYYYSNFSEYNMYYDDTLNSQY